MSQYRAVTNRNKFCVDGVHITNLLRNRTRYTEVDNRLMSWLMCQLGVSVGLLVITNDSRLVHGMFPVLGPICIVSVINSAVKVL
jgi:hypothetical protein